jgi:hypothetical protein
VFSKNGHYGVGLNVYDDGSLRFEVRQATPDVTDPGENREIATAIAPDRWYEATMIADAGAGELRLVVDGPWWERRPGTGRFTT